MHEDLGGGGGIVHDKSYCMCLNHILCAVGQRTNRLISGKITCNCVMIQK